MIKYVFNIEDYWKVIVYYNIDYNLFNNIYKDLKSIGINDKYINRIYNRMSKHKTKAITISNVNKYISVVLFNTHKTYYDYINSIIHEAEHIKQNMLYKYNVDDIGEPPAYTVGYVAMKMIMTFNRYNI